MLDELRRPTFLYRFKDVSIEDYCVDLADAGVPRLRRTVTVHSNSNHDDLVFRMSPQESITQGAAGEFQIGAKMLVRVQRPHAGSILGSEVGQWIQIPIDVKAGQPRQLILEYAWPTTSR